MENEPPQSVHICPHPPAPTLQDLSYAFCSPQDPIGLGRRYGGCAPDLRHTFPLAHAPGCLHALRARGLAACGDNSEQVRVNVNLPPPLSAPRHVGIEAHGDRNGQAREEGARPDFRPILTLPCAATQLNAQTSEVRILLPGPQTQTWNQISALKAPRTNLGFGACRIRTPP